MWNIYKLTYFKNFGSKNIYLIYIIYILQIVLLKYRNRGYTPLRHKIHTKKIIIINRLEKMVPKKKKIFVFEKKTLCFFIY